MRQLNKKRKKEIIEENYRSPATQVENSGAESEGQGTAGIGSKFEFCF